jgi:hypothetical protein
MGVINLGIGEEEIDDGRSDVELFDSDSEYMESDIDLSPDGGK